MTGLDRFAVSFDKFMNGFQLTFAKAWSQLPAESPVVLPWDRGCWKHVVAGKSLFRVQPAVLKRPLPPQIVYSSSPGDQQPQTSGTELRLQLLRHGTKLLNPVVKTVGQK